VENSDSLTNPAAREDKCCFLLTGDLHGRLSEAAEAQLSMLRREQENTLLVDAGDAVQASNLGAGRPGQPLLERMNRIGYDAMAMGNRESHPLRTVLQKKLSQAGFPILAANLMAKRQPLPSKVKSHIIKTLANGWRVALIGLAPQITAPESWWSRVTDYVFDDPIKAATGLAAKLRPQVELVVLLSHCGLAIDRQLSKIEDVDLVLGGHSHEEVFLIEAGAPILHSGWGGKYFGLVEVTGLWGRNLKVTGKIQPFETLR
jgi:2',3'-cyclic-nucleotide 2'-phosphodiesterase (5'-nucleotidase family)